MKKFTILIGMFLITGLIASGCSFMQGEEQSDTQTPQTETNTPQDVEEDVAEPVDPVDVDADLKDATEEESALELYQKSIEEKNDPFTDELSLYKSITNSETINSADCEKLKDENLLYQCQNKAYSSEALTAKDEKLCEKISDDQDKEECISEVELLFIEKKLQ